MLLVYERYGSVIDYQWIAAVANTGRLAAMGTTKTYSGAKGAALKFARNN